MLNKPQESWESPAVEKKAESSSSEESDEPSENSEGEQDQETRPVDENLPPTPKNAKVPHRI